MRNTIHSLDIGRITQLIMRPNWPRERERPKVDLYPEATAIGRDGLLILKGLIEPQVCDRVVQNYSEYEQLLLEAGVRLRDSQNRNHRLTNFHLISAAAMQIACDERIHEHLDEYFGRRSMVYTSLYFKHGSQQKPHLDTPFFVTNPIGWFAGVWVALEDVRPSAGPVQYFARAHRLFDTRAKLRELHSGCQDLDTFFDRVAQRAAQVSELTPALLKKGDVLIWHHGLPHGGRKAENLELTRHSLVFHMAAEGVNVRYSGLFEEPRSEMPRYGLSQHGARTVARLKLPHVMY